MSINDNRGQRRRAIMGLLFILKLSSRSGRVTTDFVFRRFSILFLLFLEEKGLKIKV